MDELFWEFPLYFARPFDGDLFLSFSDGETMQLALWTDEDSALTFLERNRIDAWPIAIRTEAELALLIGYALGCGADSAVVDAMKPTLPENVRQYGFDIFLNKETRRIFDGPAIPRKEQNQ